MICPLCGKENSNTAEKCMHCGYESEKAFSRRVIDANKAVLRSVKEEVEKEKAADESPIDSSIIEKCSKVYNIPPDPIEEMEITNVDYTEQSKRNLTEYLLAAGLFGTALAVFIHFIVNDPWGNPFNITGMGIIGGIGLIAAILAMAFEGGFPISIKGLLACSALLVFAMEFPITTPLLLFVYAVCIYSLIIAYGGRMAGVALGTVAIICLPFWGVILLILIEMMLGGGSRRSNNSRKDKK